MSAFETVGFGVVVLGTALFVALTLILAAFGGYVLLKCADRGFGEIKLDIRDSARMQNEVTADDVIKGRR